MTDSKKFDIIKSSKERKVLKMRKLLYDCYCGNVLVKTVATQKEAKEWKELHSKNFYKIRLEKTETL